MSILESGDMPGGEQGQGRYVYAYPRPMVTVDAVVFAMREGQWHLLLIQRKNAPFAGCWALPGGFVEMEEGLDMAAARELAEETGITGVSLAQLRAFGAPGRDPRGRNICVAFVGVLPGDGQEARGGDDASAAEWFPVMGLPRLAFDHGDIVEYALKWLRERGNKDSRL